MSMEARQTPVSGFHSCRDDGGGGGEEEMGEEGTMEIKRRGRKWRVSLG